MCLNWEDNCMLEHKEHLPLFKNKTEKNLDFSCMIITTVFECQMIFCSICHITTFLQLYHFPCYCQCCHYDIVHSTYVADTSGIHFTTFIATVTSINKGERFLIGWGKRRKIRVFTFCVCFCALNLLVLIYYWKPAG